MSPFKIVFFFYLMTILVVQASSMHSSFRIMILIKKVISFKYYVETIRV
jgi:hypothetical protein